MSWRVLTFFLGSLIFCAACRRSVPQQTSVASAVPVNPSVTASASSVPAQASEPKAKPLSSPIPSPSDVAAPPFDAEKTPSGLATKVLTAGNGAQHPAATDFVLIDYTGWTRDGAMFDGTRGKPRRFDLTQMIAGLNEALRSMVPGEKRRLWVPKELGYANLPHMIGYPKGDLTYDLELKRVIPVPVAPADVSAPPRDAKSTKSGLRYRVLRPGTGSEHPSQTSRVAMSYIAWTPQGRRFETSLIVDDSIPARLERLIPGWSEGLMLMTEGEQMRLWIPAKLAYGEAVRGQEEIPFLKPSGPVVFDVELVKILK